jgi:uncharacterized cofD-like protein
MLQVVTLGGGSGHAQVLKALRVLPGIEITAVCPSTDSGGSTGVLAHEYGGGGYIGDLTKCLLALGEDIPFKTAMAHRFGKGALEGHTVRNVFFHALIEAYGLEKALHELWRLGRIFPHRIFPVSYEYAELCATLSFGGTVVGETAIDTLATNPLWHPNAHAIDEVYLKPVITACSPVLESLGAADYIVICPGDLYSSVIPTLLPEGMKEALHTTDARLILMLNIMTKQGETDNYTAHDFVAKIEAKLGRRVDYILHNNKEIPEYTRTKYYASQQKVEFTASTLQKDERLIEAPFATVTPEGYVVSNPVVMEVVFDELFKAGREVEK